MRLVTILKEQHLVYVPTPKVASTSLFEATHALAGLELRGRKPRKMALNKYYKATLSGLGLENLRCSDVELQELREKYHSFFWFCAKRNPTERIVSIYRSKLHRYAIHANRAAYRWGIWGQILEGPKAIHDSRYLAKRISKTIGFDEMLTGLKSTGLEFDGHFRQQHKIVCLDSVEYSTILRQEHLEEDFHAMCKMAGLEPLRLPGLRQINESLSPKEVPVILSARSLQLIAELYAGDFERLGYPAP